MTHTQTLTLPDPYPFSFTPPDHPNPEAPSREEVPQAPTSEGEGGEHRNHDRQRRDRLLCHLLPLRLRKEAARLHDDKAIKDASTPLPRSRK